MSARLTALAKQDGGVWCDRVHTEAVGGKNTCKQIKAAMLTRLSKMRKLLPFVRLSYAGLSSHMWFDEKGERHVVNQAEGGEQGNALMPLLFSIGIQGALEVVAGQLQDGDHVFAFLGDVNFCANHIECTLCMGCSRPFCGETRASQTTPCTISFQGLLRGTTKAFGVRPSS